VVVCMAERACAVTRLLGLWCSDLGGAFLDGGCRVFVGGGSLAWMKSRAISRMAHDPTPMIPNVT